MEIIVSYQNLKALMISKGLSIQFVEEEFKYNVFILDSSIIYMAHVWKEGFEPLEGDVEQNTTDREDFEGNYIEVSNAPIEHSIKFREIPAVGITKVNIGFRAWTFSHNFCDPTTWFGDAVRVVDEAVGTGNDTTTIFSLDHTNIIDITHGKITEEDYIVPTVAQGGTSYQLIVKIDGEAQTERAFGEDSGGDYTVNYSTGEITFVSAPATDAVITADYFYENGSTVYIRPSDGMKMIVTTAECQFASNFEMTDNLITAIYTYNPYLGAPPAKFEYPNTRSRYKRMWDFINYTNGSFPKIPPLGGSVRGSTNDIFQLRYDYVTTIELPSSAGAELRIWTENHVPYIGEVGCITFYGYSISE